MKKKVKCLNKLFSLFLFFFNSSLMQAQNLIRIENRINLNNIASAKLFVLNHTTVSSNQKYASVIFNGQISKNFDYLKTIDMIKSRKIMKHLTSKSTYGGEDYACFETDYGIVLYDVKKVIIGYVNISFFCDKIISDPDIPECNNYSSKNQSLAGFSIKGRKNLLQLLGIKHSDAIKSQWWNPNFKNIR
jgi:hypothetical protein